MRGGVSKGGWAPITCYLSSVQIGAFQHGCFYFPICIRKQAGDAVKSLVLSFGHCSQPKFNSNKVNVVLNSRTPLKGWFRSIFLP